MKKLFLFLPLLALTLLFAAPARADDYRHKRNRNDGYDRVYNSGGKRNRNDGLDRYYNSRRSGGIERRNYQGRSRYYRNGQYYYRGRDGYYPYGSRPDRGGVSIGF